MTISLLYTSAKVVEKDGVYDPIDYHGMRIEKNLYETLKSTGIDQRWNELYLAPFELTNNSHIIVIDTGLRGTQPESVA